MKRYIVVISCVLFSVIAASAQTPTDKSVAAVRKVYDMYSAQAKQVETDDEQGEIGPLIMNELTLNTRDHQWRAVGKYNDKYLFFYDGGDDEKELYPEDLRLVKRVSLISDRPNTEEYLYNDDGRLIFHKQTFVHHEEGTITREIYFSVTKLAVKAIRIVQNGKPRDKFSSIDAAVISETIKSSEKLYDLFKQSIHL